MFQRQSGYLWWKLIALLARCRRSFWHDLRKREGGRGETFWKTPVLWKTFGGARDKQKGGNTSSQCWSPRQIWPWTTGKKQQLLLIVANMKLNNRILKMSRFRPPMDVGRVREGDCYFQYFDFLSSSRRKWSLGSQPVWAWRRCPLSWFTRSSWQSSNW